MNSSLNDIVRKVLEISNNSSSVISNRNNSATNDVSLYSVSGRGFHATQTYRYGTHINGIGNRRVNPNDVATIGVSGNVVGF